MPDIYFDFGNADAKYFDGVKTFGHFRHALAPLSDAEWKKIVGRAKQPPKGFISVEGKHFAYGDKARRYTLKEKPRGAARYSQEYYGVALMAAISEVFETEHRVMNVYASHAPRDINYAQDIRRSVLGRWHFNTHKGQYNLKVKTVETYDEPLGGFNHAMLTKDGKVLKNNEYRDKTSLVVDVGGFTVDVIAVDPNGMIDERSLRSTVTGVINVYEMFENELRSKYSDLFKDVDRIDEYRLEKALTSGHYQYGNMKLDCADIANEAITILVNDILDVISASGGVANFDVILLTGGGSALVYERLKRALSTIDFIMVEKERELMRYANVFGGAKLFAMLKRLGAI